MENFAAVLKTLVQRIYALPVKPAKPLQNSALPPADNPRCRYRVAPTEWGLTSVPERAHPEPSGRCLSGNSLARRPLSSGNPPVAPPAARRLGASRRRTRSLEVCGLPTPKGLPSGF